MKKRILTNRSITIMVLITFIIIFLVGIVQMATSADMRDYDGDTWENWSFTSKQKFISGYILGQVFVHEMLEEDFPAVALGVDPYILYDVAINDFIALVDKYYSYPRQKDHSLYLVLSYIYYSPEYQGGI